MKTTRLFLCLVFAFCSAASAAELLWTDFDASPTGSVANLPGWTRAAWLGGITARVDNINYSHSPSNILELPWNATASSAVYTNFNSTYTTNEHPVIRCSAKLVTINTNAYFQLGLRNSSSGARLTFEGTNGFGTFGTETHDSVFFPLVNDRFVDVTFFYNRSNNYYRLDYNYTNRLAWTTNNAPSSVVHTQFNQFVVSRPGGTAGTTGTFIVDDVSVETFPPHVWAWFRCDSTRQLIDHLGAFMPTQAYASAILPGASDPAWDGTADFHNEGAGRSFYSSPANGALALPPSVDWTAEAVFNLPPGSGNACFLAWGKGQGFSTTGAYINIGWSAVDRSFYFALRDSQQADANYEWSTVAGAFVPDGRWHHFAFVKASSDVSVYLDYVQITNFSLTTGYADGSYAFDSQFHATVGMSLNYGNTSGPDTYIDEVRVSGKGLARSEFLQPGQPVIVSIADESPWHIPIKGILGHRYRLEASPVFGPGAAWQSLATTTVVSTFAAFDVAPAAATNFFRVIREN